MCCLLISLTLLTAARCDAPGGAQESNELALRVEDIQKRVAIAGGKTDGVVVASISWSTPDDLDLHVVTPTGAEISYRNRQADGGELDVDMCVRGRHGGVCAERPVENIVFMERAPWGRYKVYVQNFNYHANVRSKSMQASSILEGKPREYTKEERDKRTGTNRHVGFQVLVKVEQSYRLFSDLCTPAGKTHEQSNVRVFEFDYAPGSPIKSIFESPGDPACGTAPQLEGPEQQRKLPGGAGGPGGVQSRYIPPIQAPAPARSGSKSAKGGSEGRGGGQKASARARGAEQARGKALELVRSSSRETLLAKPAGALQGLLRDLDTTCRGCLDKSELVDRLFGVAGIGREDL